MKLQGFLKYEEFVDKLKTVIFPDKDSVA